MYHELHSCFLVSISSTSCLIFDSDHELQLKCITFNNFAVSYILFHINFKVGPAIIHLMVIAQIEIYQLLLMTSTVKVKSAPNLENINKDLQCVTFFTPAPLYLD